MATFRRSPEETIALVREVIEEHYPDLRELMDHERFPLKIDCLDVHADLDGNGEPVGPALKHGGYAVAADIRATPKAQRALGMGAVLLRIDADHWSGRSPEERAALIDHELYHLLPKRDKPTGEGDESTAPFKRDDLGFPLFAMRLHDVEVGWFVEVAKRRGFDSVEVQQAKRISEKWGQFLFDFATTESLPGLKTLPPASANAAAAESDPGTGEWLLAEQLSADQKDDAEATYGSLQGQFFVDEDGTVIRHKLIDSAPSPVNEAAATPKPKTGRRAASKAHGDKPAGSRKRSSKKAA